MNRLKRYSSCDACKRARLGCNASSQGGGPCFNCSRKGITCTSTQNQRRFRPKSKGEVALVEQSVAETSSATPDAFSDERDNGPEAPTSSTPADPSIFALSETQHRVTRSQQALLLHETLWNIFTTLLEPRIGLWIGGSCCPFQSTKTVGGVWCGLK